MKGKSTGLPDSWEEGKTGETRSENPRETSEKWLDLRHTVTCNDESLLKACALRQEKPSFCHKNGAARAAHIGAPRKFKVGGRALELCRQVQIAGPADLDALAQMDALARGDRAPPHQVADGAAG